MWIGLGVSVAALEKKTLWFTGFLQIIPFHGDSVPGSSPVGACFLDSRRLKEHIRLLSALRILIPTKKQPTRLRMVVGQSCSCCKAARPQTGPTLSACPQGPGKSLRKRTSAGLHGVASTAQHGQGNADPPKEPTPKECCISINTEVIPRSLDV